jgi:hypothetical protein
VPSKSLQLVEAVEVSVDFVPVYTEILMREHVPEASQWSQFAGKLRWQHAYLPQAPNGFVVVSRLRGFLNGDNAVADIDAALGCHLEVTLRDVP